MSNDADASNEMVVCNDHVAAAARDAVNRARRHT
jgi:hypothetical protein